MMDKFQQCVADSSFAQVLLANETTGDWELLEPETVPADTAQTYHERGLAFAGVLGVVAGKPRSVLAMPFDDEIVTAISAEFVRRWAHTKSHPRWCCKAAPGVN